MNLVTVIWSMVAAACITLAVVHVMVWLSNRSAWANLLFALTALGVAALAGIEVGMMTTATPGQYATLLRWYHVPIWIVILSLVGFIRLHLRAGRVWLAGTVVGVRTLALLVNFLVGENLNYQEISALRPVRFLGEMVAVPIGTTSPFVLLGQASLLLLVLFVADASLTVWRRAERRSALLLGGSMVCFTLLGMFQSVLIFWGWVAWPLTVSFFFLPAVAVMGYELSRDTLAATRLVRELRASQQQLELAATAQRQAAEEARQHRAELAHVSRSIMLGELSASLAHELNQPLGAILRNAEAAEIFLQQPAPDLEELRAIVADIRHDNHRAGAVISRMRAFLQRHEVERQPVDPALLGREVVNLVRAEAVQRVVRLDLQLETPLPTIMGDRIQLQQVLLNLLLNAFDAVQEVAPENRHVTVRVQCTGGLVTFAVHDAGPGILPHQLPRLFEPFFTTKAKGLGMGLAISRTIVESHGGRLVAENLPAGGASFRFALPVAG
jgi:C4-dicarboxylate-specific signal transduction histidine kinase/type III secretory pathway component EscS